MVRRCIVRKNTNRSQQVHCKSLVTGLTACHSRFHEERHQRNEGTNIDHFNSKVFLEAGARKEANQFGDIRNDLNELLAIVNLKKSFQNREKVVGDIQIF